MTDRLCSPESIVSLSIDTCTEMASERPRSTDIQPGGPLALTPVGPLNSKRTSSSSVPRLRTPICSVDVTPGVKLVALEGAVSSHPQTTPNTNVKSTTCSAPVFASSEVSVTKQVPFQCPLASGVMFSDIISLASGCNSEPTASARAAEQLESEDTE